MSSSSGRNDLSGRYRGHFAQSDIIEFARPQNWQSVEHTHIARNHQLGCAHGLLMVLQRLDAGIAVFGEEDELLALLLPYARWEQ